MSPSLPQFDPVALDSAERIVLRARWLWRLCLGLPFLYLGTAAIIERIWFVSSDSPGIWPMGEGRFTLLVLILCAGAVALQIGMLGVRYQFARRLLAADRSRLRLADLYWRRTLRLVLLSDLVSGLGLVAFIFGADWRPLVGFCMGSYFLYAQAYPRARLLDRPADDSGAA